MEEKIQTLHPDPAKRGVHISKAKYDLVRATVLEVLSEKGGLTFTQLSLEVEKRLSGHFNGSIPWYTISVQLDLEARHVVERTDETPHRVRIKA
jgi:hypothetical protein